MKRWVGVATTGALALVAAGAVAIFVFSGPACQPQQLTCIAAPAPYDAVVRESRYVDLGNGRRLAVDILRPSKGGHVETKRLPVLFSQTIYNRAATLVHNGSVAETRLMSFDWFQKTMMNVMAAFNGGRMIADQTTMSPWLKAMVQDGYIVVAADAAGTGASFGQPHRHIEGYIDDASRMLDWIVAQSWSDGRVGVYGQSFVALTAYAAIASRHPAIKAGFVSATPLDPYLSVAYPGGLYAKGFGESYIALTADLDKVATPVDGDELGQQLALAMSERKDFTFSDLVADLFRTTPSRDGRSTYLGQSWDDISLAPVMEAVSGSDVPIYAIGGWLDIFSDDTIRLNGLSKGADQLGPPSEANFARPNQRERFAPRLSILRRTADQFL